VFILDEVNSNSGRKGHFLAIGFQRAEVHAASGGRTKVLGRKLNWALAGGVVVLAALIAIGVGSSDRVAAGSCGSGCKSAYNQCRISTKGSASCEIAFTRCMQSCITGK
jgi:hypothetical protein